MTATVDIVETTGKLPPRWTPMRPHKVQIAYSNSPHRFNTVPAGRRSGKTERAKRKLIRKCLEAQTTWLPRYFAAAPTMAQAIRIFWGDLKELSRGMWRMKPSESMHTLFLYTGDIEVVGLDKPERIEGSPWDGGLIDEIGNCKPSAWPQNIRPALSDRRGWCDLIGVPEGRNHYYELDTSARAQMLQLGDKSEWGSFTWFSADILPPEEIEAAKRDLDELTYQQEYEGSFVSFEGRCYYGFTTATHTATLVYDPKAALAFCFDFNVEPGVCAIIQEQRLPKQFEHEPLLGTPLLGRPITGTGVIAEVHIPRNSNTPAVCRKLIQMFPDHQGPVRCYGDATGGAEGTAKVEGSDWTLVEKELRPKYRERLEFCVKRANPPERTRVNAVNSRCLNTAQDIRLMVDPFKAPHVVKDFEGVALLKGGSGEIDKKINLALTHLTDAIGYYIDHEFPISGAGLIKIGVAGH